MNIRIVQAQAEWKRLWPSTKEAIEKAAQTPDHTVAREYVLTEDGHELVNEGYFRSIGDGSKFAITQHAFALFTWSKQNGKEL